MNLDRLLQCHSRLASLLGERAEPVEATKNVERHRWFWRPGQPRLILLAESHVHTTAPEATCLVRSSDLPGGIPTEFVRLVYCLGYGESGLLDRQAVGKNTGTPQFWQILASCLRTVNSRYDFRDIQSSQTRNLKHRVDNKIRVLERLQAEGIWLVDASIAALYRPGLPKPVASLRRCLVRESWDTYVAQVLTDVAHRRFCVSA
jgi:hypothetical protein